MDSIDQAMSSGPSVNGWLGPWMAAFLLAGIVLCAPARAQSSALNSGWQYKFTPYF